MIWLVDIALIVTFFVIGATLGAIVATYVASKYYFIKGMQYYENHMKMLINQKRQKLKYLDTKMADIIEISSIKRLEGNHNDSKK